MLVSCPRPRHEEQKKIMQCFAKTLHYFRRRNLSKPCILLLQFLDYVCYDRRRKYRWCFSVWVIFRFSESLASSGINLHYLALFVLSCGQNGELRKRSNLRISRLVAPLNRESATRLHRGGQEGQRHNFCCGSYILFTTRSQESLTLTC